MDQAPRLYNLFPTLAGGIEDWADHLPRIAAMGFDWIYVNPIHYPGFSGSLYAVKDHFRLHPVVQGQSKAKPDDLVRRFTADAAEHGVKVMLDLVINHVSKDCPLVARHPHWFLRDEEGAVVSPSVRDPDDPDMVTEWGDLAEIDYANPALQGELIAYWGSLARHYAELGVAGFRCDAAYKVPAPVWRGIIDAVRDVRPNCVFAAETLGCRPEEVVALHDAGFDLIFNSSKWWDFREDWLLAQYRAFRRIAPSIAFPESHDTERLAAEIPQGQDVVAHYRLRALFAAFFSSGWMMPMGFEYGFRRKLDVVTTRPDDWEKPSFDLTGFIADVNRMKAASPALNVEGPQERLPAPAPVVALLRRSEDESQDGDLALALINPDPTQSCEIDLERLLQPVGLSRLSLSDVTPGREGKQVSAGVTLAPLDMRVFRAALADQAGDSVEAESGSTIIENVQPQIDGGRFPVKREVGDSLEVTADIFRHGHDILGAQVLWREKGDGEWHNVPMIHQDNDRWIGHVPLSRNTRYDFTIEAWMDEYESWRHELAVKRKAGQVVALEIAEGRALLKDAVTRAAPDDADRLNRVLADLTGPDEDQADLLSSTLVRQVMSRAGRRVGLTRFRQIFPVTVDRVAARFAAWYEMFHRSQGTDPKRGATFKDCEKRLPEIRRMGFDVVYLLPIHPIGKVHRKGPDNTLNAGPHDPGSPYAIGSDEGGHKAVNPELGTLDDFRHFVAAVERHGMEVALDFAIQCAPDHPYVTEHPEWFNFRPDGTIKYAENPPKKYQDIVNINLDPPTGMSAWAEMRDVFLFWVAQGVKIFRVDNPHTKPVPFWEWVINQVQDRHPEVIFLAEAFTRPKMMQRLAKVGFTQSYTYFTWRNFKPEIEHYLTELTQSGQRDYFRPNFFPSTPDILPPFLQTGGRPAFVIRLVLAATLSSVYGIYNSYELCEAAAVPGKEEYLHSEKYQYKVWDWNRPGNIKAEITALNAIRRDNKALHEFENLRFHRADDDNVLFYGKMSLDRANMIFIAVNLDPFDAHDSVLHFPLDEMGVPPGETFEVEELLTGAKHLWRGAQHKIHLDPHKNPAMILRVTVWTSVDYRTPCG